MKYIEDIEVFIMEKYKYSDVVIGNIPKNPSKIESMKWIDDVLKAYINKYPPRYNGGKEVIWSIGRLKSIITTYNYKYEVKYEDYAGKFSEWINQEEYFEDPMDSMYGEFSDGEENFAKNYNMKIDKGDEHLKWSHDLLMYVDKWSRKITKDPDASLVKLFNKVKDYYDILRDGEFKDSVVIDFFDKISAQSNARLSLSDQKKVRTDKLLKNNNRILDFVFGGREVDLDAQMRLNTNLDLYVFPKVPTGGRLAQTMPETLLVNYYRNMKQNTLAMGFSQEKFIKFIEKFIGLKNVSKWLKTGVVYRLGYKPVEEKKYREWSPGSASKKGIRSFVGTIGQSIIKYPKYFYNGKAKYFDLYGYMEFISKELGYGSYGDGEKEILIKDAYKMNYDIINNEEDFIKILEY